MSLSLLVTDGTQRAALAVVRSLGRAGHRVVVAAERLPALAAASRYAAEAYRVPDPLTHAEAFAERIAELATRTSARMVLPITDAALTALLPHRESLGALLPVPGREIVARAANKEVVLGTARALGIAVPEQVVLDGPAAAAHPGLSALGFPLVLKPHRSVAGDGADRVKLGVRYAASRVELVAILGAWPAAAFPVLAQRRIVGPGTGVFMLLWEGQLLATFCHRRLREKPPSGGVSVRAESVPPDPALVAQAERLLRALDWQGVAMVEFKHGADGIPRLMEVNGRFWGSLQLAVDAGVDFPRLLVEAASERNPAPVTRWRAGVVRRWTWGEVDHLLARLRRSPEALSLPPGEPAAWRVALDLFAAPFLGVRGEVCRLADPGPGLRETLDWFRGR